MAQLNIDREKLSNSQVLRICVYLIERKCDFNGEGVFLNADTIEFGDEESIQMEAILENIKHS